MHSSAISTAGLTGDSVPTLDNIDSDSSRLVFELFFLCMVLFLVALVDTRNDLLLSFTAF